LTVAISLACSNSFAFDAIPMLSKLKKLIYKLRIKYTKWEKTDAIFLIKGLRIDACFHFNFDLVSFGFRSNNPRVWIEAMDRSWMRLKMKGIRSLNEMWGCIHISLKTVFEALKLSCWSNWDAFANGSFRLRCPIRIIVKFSRCWRNQKAFEESIGLI